MLHYISATCYIFSTKTLRYMVWFFREWSFMLWLKNNQSRDLCFKFHLNQLQHLHLRSSFVYCSCLYLTVKLSYTGCPRMFYTVFQKNIKNVKSTMSFIVILVIECLICALPTVKISFTYLYPLRCDMVSLKIEEYPECHFSAKGQFLKTSHKQTRALNSSCFREKSTLAEQYLAWTTVWIIKRWKRVQVAYNK